MTIAIFGIIMENFPNICSCLFAFNIILRLARNCHIKQIFENFSFSLYPLTITLSRRLPPPFSPPTKPVAPYYHSPCFSVPFFPHAPRTVFFRFLPRFFSTRRPLPLPPLPSATLPAFPFPFFRTRSPPRRRSHHPPHFPYRFLSLPLSRRPSAAANDRPLSAHTRFNLKKVFVIYVQKRKFVVE